jgi:hypothetical protein
VRFISSPHRLLESVQTFLTQPQVGCGALEALSLILGDDPVLENLRE